MVSSLRIPDVLRARIDSAAGDGKRSEWILEACRMRLDGTSGGMADAGDLKSSSLGSDGSSPSSSTNSGVAQLAERIPYKGEDAGSIPAPATKVPSASLRAICAGKVTNYGTFEEWTDAPHDMGPRCVVCDSPMREVKGKWACFQLSCGQYGIEQKVRP